MGVELRADTGEALRLLERVERRLGSMQPGMEAIGETVLASIQRNFEAGGRPAKWPALADSTIRQRIRRGNWPGQILVRKGVSGGLLGSLSYDAAPRHVLISANKEYAAIHHFGGKAGRGRKTTIPARPYMMIQDEDWAEITAALNDFIFGEGAGHVD